MHLAMSTLVYCMSGSMHICTCSKYSSKDTLKMAGSVVTLSNMGKEWCKHWLELKCLCPALAQGLVGSQSHGGLRQAKKFSGGSLGTSSPPTPTLFDPSQNWDVKVPNDSSCGPASVPGCPLSNSIIGSKVTEVKPSCKQCTGRTWPEAVPRRRC